MAKTHGSKAKIWMDTQAGVCTQITPDITEITFNRSRSDPETTALGDNSVQRDVAGIRDATLEFSGIWNATNAIGASGIVDLLDDAYSGSLVTRFIYCPAGSTTGCPVYTASMMVQSLAHRSPVGGISTVNFSAALASGSVLAACCV